ncbi:hypothetical protein Pla111_03580 [Botrimarina hoheduenensis]|uniref:Flippase-like domain-containing protein n=1 Tax=Botrimarina hoheduenensis TaxID=2528000 RepID=A0A5C5WD43_9BACT|nr:hypothetical protein Pla111_03580 [Botrimarina hoheduenensis]
MLELPALRRPVNAAPALPPPLRPIFVKPSPEIAGRGRLWIPAVQLLIGLTILLLLLWQAASHEALADLTRGQKSGAGIAGAAGLLIGSVGLSFLRWRLIAGAAGLEMSVSEAFRLGAAGFATNFVALGNIGGDVVKAALLAHRRRGQRALAVSTVVVDRAMGLLALLLFASAGILAGGVFTGDRPLALRAMAHASLAITVVAILCFALAIAPGRPLWRLASWVRRIPRIGRLLGQAALLIDAYRHGRLRLMAALGVGLMTDAAFVLSFYTIAKSLPLDSPGLAEHFVIVPLGLIAGALPISPSGLGTVEATVDLLYQSLGKAVPAGHGSLVAFAHRLLMLGVGAVAVVYYLASGTRDRAASAISEDNKTTAVEGSGTAEPIATPAASRQTV